ncbi:antitoxin [Candidatus Woesearchaeota archaeon CG10_big_fil_rev_8_21_14_0_10_37_12]|nr:MAG: antitoxin [Candidatus Woesearchaeota archaeon CG10_big_fil_rev_8_21_14_0_10_37_12]
MVQAMIQISEETNRVLNIVKAKAGLKDKSEAINYVVSKYEENLLEPELRPEYIKKIQNIERKGKFSKYKNLADLRREIEHA